MIDLIFEQGENLLTFIRPWILNIVLALIVFLLGLIGSKLAKRVLLNILQEIEINAILKKTTGIKINVAGYITDFVGYFIIFLAVAFGIELLGWGSIVLYILLSTVMLIIIVSLALGLKDFVPNIISGLVLHRKFSIKIGDYIKVKNVEGEVVQFNLLEVRIRTEKGDEIVIPNSLLTKNEIVKIKKH